MLDSNGSARYLSPRMLPAIEAETETNLLETVRALPLESQRAVLSDALFLQHQEKARRIEADEADWDRLCSQPEKMERFMEWAQRSLAEHPPEPFDESRL